MLCKKPPEVHPYVEYTDTLSRIQREHRQGALCGLEPRQQIDFLLRKLERAEQQVYRLQDERAANYERWWRLSGCNPGITGYQPEADCCMDSFMRYHRAAMVVLDQLVDRYCPHKKDKVPAMIRQEEERA